MFYEVDSPARSKVYSQFTDSVADRSNVSWQTMCQALDSSSDRPSHSSVLQSCKPFRELGQRFDDKHVRNVIERRRAVYLWPKQSRSDLRRLIAEGVEKCICAV